MKPKKLNREKEKYYTDISLFIYLLSLHLLTW